ncbi:MAG TPA: PIG-L deacetylase family protein [Planctomycetota bacterium]|nr:PIG-L deacetylase family protein [Planctomycetota bacterium]
MSAFADRLRQAVARRFFVALRRATHRMPSRLRAPQRGRVLVVAPHLDDEVIPCGGTLLLHARAGSTVHVAFTSDSGGPNPDPEARQRLRAARVHEAEQARGILGYASTESYDLPDGALVRHEAALRARLAETIRSFSPDQILCPFPGDGHADHQATALAVAGAAYDARFAGEVWAYELWTPLWPNVCVDISAVAADKERAIACYRSQLADRDYAAAILGLNRYRGLRHQVAYAEAYYVCPPLEFRHLAAELDRLR